MLSPTPPSQGQGSGSFCPKLRHQGLQHCLPPPWRGPAQATLTPSARTPEAAGLLRPAGDSGPSSKEGSAAHARARSQPGVALATGPAGCPHTARSSTLTFTPHHLPSALGRDANTPPAAAMPGRQATASLTAASPHPRPPTTIGRAPDEAGR